MIKYSDFPRLGEINSKLGWMISVGESHSNKGKPNYNIANRRIGTGVIKTNNKGAKFEVMKFPVVDNAGLTKLTVRDIMRKHTTGKDNFWAVGRWQITPSPMKEFVRAFKIDERTLFDAHTQDLYVLYALMMKRPRIKAFLVDGTGSLESAALEVAKEWSSKPTSSGTSYYGGNGVDKAHITYKMVVDALNAGRKAYVTASKLYNGRSAAFILWMSLHDNGRPSSVELKPFEKYAAVQQPLNHVAVKSAAGHVGYSKVRSANPSYTEGTLIVDGTSMRFRDKMGRIFNLRV